MTIRAKRRITSRKISKHKTHKSQHRLKVELLPDSVDALSTASQSVPKATIRSSSLVPAPQAERIKQKFVQGYSIRKISREEGRARQTIAHIVRSEDVQNFVKQMQEELWGLIPAAIGALRHELETNKNSELAYQIVRDIGVFPPARIQQSSSPYDSDERVKLIIGELAKIALERNCIYGTPMPEIEEAAVIDGCTHSKVFMQIVLPISRPAIVMAFVTPRPPGTHARTPVYRRSERTRPCAAETSAPGARR